MNRELQADLVAQFAQLWKYGQRPDVFAFLADHHEAPIEEKRQVVLFDQAQRWQHDEPLFVEDYLQQLPEITDHDGSILELAASEYAQREANLQPQPFDEFLARFPQIEAALRKRLMPETVVLDGTSNQTETMTFVAAAPEARIGRFRLQRVLGEGSFAKVWLAFDEELRRQVAIKVPTKALSDAGDRDAYLAEAQTIASLDHPNIVPVFDVGKTAEEHVYIVAKFIDGGDLANWVKDRIPPIKDSVQVIATVAQALHVAHSKRLVHRDIKPANILFDADSRRPFIADFGLAIREEDYLQSGKIAGTPAYMSPEQARGEGHRLDGRSDLFSLGVVLYELLTGTRPFRGGTFYEIINQVISFDPPPPQALNPKVPDELQRVCLKALSKRAVDRYATGLEFADDLLHWLAGPKEMSKREFRIVPKGLRSFDVADADFFLDLLPGPRDRDGLPESIRFWKSRIEETDPDLTFSTGLIYGPSGCGKSSLVKAGLLPRLSNDVIATYVEATPEETESRLLRVLQKRIPKLPERLTLVESLMFLRRSMNKKVVIILDQFEQWLHAKRNESNTDLVRALRQADGTKLQVICMVRDDFAMAASRFMRELETRIVEGHNFATVDLFDIPHAERVLAKFGQAYQRLSAELNRLTPAQSQFLRDVASGLAHDGKVVSVRIALFAEMVKNKPWTPETLKQVGGTRGIGINFLEETFSSRNANPDHLLHQGAAREVLRSLLPESGTDIKGHMRSHEELLRASGYSDDLHFHDLLRILDGELRLITPTDPEGSTESRLQHGSKFYQLTHDYLVPSLREWLTRKQKETPKGRAKLLLEERSALWNRKPENQRLPTWEEYLSIVELVDSKDWTEPERLMMEHAGSHYADSLVKQLLDANLHDVPALVAKCKQIRRWSEPLLRDELERVEDSSKRKLNVCLALLPLDDRQLNYLYERVLDVPVGEFAVLRDSLEAHREQLIPKLWHEVQSAGNNDSRLHAAAALAGYDAGNSRWQQIGDDVARVLTMVNPEFLGDWIEELRPVRSRLTEPLGRIFRDRERGELQLALATSALADYASDDPLQLADLIKDASPQQFASLFPALAQHREAAIADLERELERVAETRWLDVIPTNVNQSAVSRAREIVESATGFMEDEFAFCFSAPFTELGATLELLGGAGYRPRSIRPYSTNGSISCAITWTRDERAWEWLSSTNLEYIRARDDKLRRKGYVPVDVAISEHEGLAAGFLILWQKAQENEVEVRLRLGYMNEEEQKETQSLVNAGFNCIAADLLVLDEQHAVYAGVWTRRQGQNTSTTRAFEGSVSDFREDDCPSLLVTDARLRRSPTSCAVEGGTGLVISALWNVSTVYESSVLAGLSPLEQCAHVPRFAGQGYRPVVISAGIDASRGEVVTASVWHRPLIPDKVKDEIARRQANAAVALLRLKHDRNVWPMLRHRPDPRARSYLIHRVRPLGADPHRIVADLATQRDNSIRRALILSLGESDPGAFTAEERAKVEEELLDLYAKEADSGVHGAAAWTLRQWERSVDVERVNRELVAANVASQRDWYVNGQRQSFVVIPSPGVFAVGSPPWEEGREGGPDGEVERMRYVHIGYSFAIMAYPVTVEEFLRFRRDFPYRTTFSRDTSCPINNVNWYDAAAYCSWLNEQEGIPRDQWCYLPNEQGEYAQGMRVVSNCLQLAGYRLPTDAEWEFACRAGSTTSRYYGQNADLDEYYAWTAKNALGRGTCPVGRFKPNDLGLFDMLGNVIEWIHDKYHDATQRFGADVEIKEDEVVSDHEMRAMRPSTYAWHTGEYARCAESNVYVPPNAGILNNGFRVGRTFTHPESDGIVKNDQTRVMRGVSFVHSSAPNRTSYRVQYSPNFGMIPWGLRTARTID